jgi:hypothetical protein
MTFPKLASLALIVLAATGVSSAQQKFPLHSGEWTATTADPTHPGGQPLTMPYCLNDETWTKSFVNPTCKIQNFSSTLSGATMSVDCEGKAIQMKGHVDLSFDGMTHMTAKGSMDSTANGKTTHMDNAVDYRWKGPNCDPNKDVNLKFRPH